LTFYANKNLQVAVKKRLVAVLAASVTTLFVGCGSPRGNSDASDRDPLADGTIVRSLGGEPETLDPALADDNAALALLRDLYEGLTAEAADGSLVPGSAESWTTGPDSLRWTFALRPNLHWSNGDPLTSADVVAGLERARDPTSRAPYAQLLEPVRAVFAPDTRTVVIDLTRPMPQLATVLAMPFAAPLHRPLAVIDGTITNGPYQVNSRRPGERIELERNTRYHSAGSVAIERVTYLTLEDLNTELNLYRSGALDITSEVPNSQIGWLERNLPGELHVTPYLSTYAYAVNLRRVADRDVRAAMSLAIDRALITAKVTGAGELPAASWVPSGIPGYTPAAPAWTGLDASARMKQAREHWSAARGRGTAPARMTLCTDASANHRRTAVALVDQWRSALGVDVEIVEMEWKAYLAMREQPDRCDLIRFGWSADFVDPEAFLTLFTADHPQNVAGYANPGYDALLSTAGVATAADQRAATLASAERILLQDAVVIPIFHRVSKRLVKPGIEGIAANPLGHLPSRYLRLREPEK
jgi:oligopeptide transport system substrate-binding protein